MRGWIYLLDPSCCLPLTMPDCFRIATDPLSVVDALDSFLLSPGTWVLHVVHSTFTRFTRYLLFNAEVACPFLASVPCLLHLPRACARPWHPFFVLVPRARLLPSLGPLCPCQFLVLSSVPLPSPARSALCLLLPLSAPLLVLSAFCPFLVHSTPPHLPSAFPTLLALYPSLIPT